MKKFLVFLLVVSLIAASIAVYINRDVVADTLRKEVGETIGKLVNPAYRAREKSYEAFTKERKAAYDDLGEIGGELISLVQDIMKDYETVDQELFLLLSHLSDISDEKDFAQGLMSEIVARDLELYEMDLVLEETGVMGNKDQVFFSQADKSYIEMVIGCAKARHVQDRLFLIMGISEVLKDMSLEYPELVPVIDEITLDLDYLDEIFESYLYDSERLIEKAYYLYHGLVVADYQETINQYSINIQKMDKLADEINATRMSSDDILLMEFMENVVDLNGALMTQELWEAYEAVLELDQDYVDELMTLNQQKTSWNPLSVTAYAQETELSSSSLYLLYDTAGTIKKAGEKGDDSSLIRDGLTRLAQGTKDYVKGRVEEFRLVRKGVTLGVGVADYLFDSAVMTSMVYIDYKTQQMPIDKAFTKFSQIQYYTFQKFYDQAAKGKAGVETLNDTVKGFKWFVNGVTKLTKDGVRGLTGSDKLANASGIIVKYIGDNLTKLGVAAATVANPESSEYDVGVALYDIATCLVGGKAVVSGLGSTVKAVVGDSAMKILHNYTKELLEDFLKNVGERFTGRTPERSEAIDEQAIDRLVKRMFETFGNQGDSNERLVDVFAEYLGLKGFSAEDIDRVVKGIKEKEEDGQTDSKEPDHQSEEERSPGDNREAEEGNEPIGGQEETSIITSGQIEGWYDGVNYVLMDFDMEALTPEGASYYRNTLQAAEQALNQSMPGAIDISFLDGEKGLISFYRVGSPVNPDELSYIIDPIEFRLAKDHLTADISLQDSSENGRVTLDMVVTIDDQGGILLDGQLTLDITSSSNHEFYDFHVYNTR